MSKKIENKAMRLEMVKIDHSQFAAEILRGNANVNLTQMAKSFGKRVNNWLRTEETKSYLNAMSVTLKSVTADLVEVRQGGTPDKQGVWCTDYRIAMRFAQWLSPEFSIAVDDMLVRLIFGEAALAEPINGIDPLLCEGKAWYNYPETLRSFGLSGRSSAASRKRLHSEHFRLIYGRNFITADYFRLLQGYYSYKQLSMNFNVQ